MSILIILIFVVGYLAIAFEHPIRIDKSAIAIITGVLCWTALIVGNGAHDGVNGVAEIEGSLLHHLGEISQILFFLLAAMTIVELIDTYGGFNIITAKIKTTNRVKLLWILGVVTFFLSSILDNLTTTIVMAALLKKLVTDKEDLWFYGGIVVIAANAGGAWSPIGDVTTIMLWIGGQISAANIITTLLVPSIFCLVVPLIYLSMKLKGDISKPEVRDAHHEAHVQVSHLESKIVFWVGIGGLLFVPIFKNLTHLPPFMGMLLSLGILWVLTELMHFKKEDAHRHALSVTQVIRKVDTPSILFFLGILLAVASLQTAGYLSEFALILDKTFGNIYVINIIIGIVSSIVDNVPLVAGAMGMYSLADFPQDHPFWELLAYCAGTGGSMLIIGSAAGVAIMGLLKIDFMWYLKKISLLAFLGYMSGIAVYYAMTIWL